MKEALFYEKSDNRSVRCYLCCHYCRIAEGKFGFCGVRQNIAGTLYTYVYTKAAASCVDPIEKKPLYHFLPGSTSFSFAAIGCNFRCGFCQNWRISQAAIRTGDFTGDDFAPQKIVDAALKHRCKSISYTYTEPTVFFEYSFDTAKLARKNGLANNFITNGYMSRQALETISPYLSAANVDLKFFKDESYRRICSGALQPVLDIIIRMKEAGIWVEVTTLIIPGENDSEEELRAIAGFLAGVDKNMPWHISRFHPDYKFISMPESSLWGRDAFKKARDIGYAAGLRYVYIGNIDGLGEDTLCHNCKKMLIKREGFAVLEYNISAGRCGYCDEVIPGVFEEGRDGQK